MRRTVIGVLIAVVILVGGWAALTLRAEFADANGAPAIVVVATWMRNNNMTWLTAKLEDVYYTYVDKPQVGGVPTVSADLSTDDAGGDVQLDGPATSSSPAASPDASSSGAASATPAPSASDSGMPTTPSGAPSPGTERAHLTPPDTLVSPVSPAQPKEGVWQPVGTRVDGIPAVYVTRVRADDVHTSYYASVMWIDTLLAKAMFVPGYQEPGGPNPYNGALPKDDWATLLANVNGAFRLDDTQGGYYYQGTMVRPLVNGKASTVIYKDGSIRVGKWGRDLQMTPDVDVVRQNLNLIVDHGQSKVSSPADNVVWGATTDKESLAWRAAMGQRADGSIVYVGSPYLSAQGLADTLVRAGVQRAMVLDMNNWWTAGFYFKHDASGAPVCRKLDPAIQEGCDRFLKPYKRDSFHFLAVPESAVPAFAIDAATKGAATAPTSPSVTPSVAPSVAPAAPSAPASTEPSAPASPAAAQTSQPVLLAP